MSWFEDMKNRIIRKFKEVTGLGSYPDFFIIGAQKSGTTSLYEYLVKSSTDILHARSKELYFFSEFFDRGFRFYESNFPILKKRKMTGEATPDYLFYHKCPSRIYEYNPKAKIIVILRDPVERAFSQYAHQNYTWKTRAADPMFFSDAIRAEEERFKVEDLSKFYYEYKYYSYKSRGLYYKQICNWLSLFPLNQLYIVFMDDLEKEPKKLVSGVLEFLGARNNVQGVKYAVRNKSPDSAISDGDRLYLREFFKEDSDSLFKLLGETPRW